LTVSANDCHAQYVAWAFILPLIFFFISTSLQAMAYASSSRLLSLPGLAENTATR
jgi:hypothetical protein